MKRILVFFGGCSTEYGVSLESAHAATWTGPTTGPSRWASPGGPLALLHRPTGRHSRRPVAGGALPCTLCLGRGARTFCCWTARPFPLRRLSGAPRQERGGRHPSGSAGAGGRPRHRLRRPVPPCMEGRHGRPWPGWTMPRRGTEAARPRKRWAIPLFVKPVRAGSSFGITRVAAPGQLGGRL